MTQSPVDHHQAISAAAPSLYVNYFEVAQNPYEFLIELGQYRPGKEEGKGTLVIHTRVAMSPPYARMLSEMLSRAVREHEQEHGTIASIHGATPFDVVLDSLPEFEDRARKLRGHADTQRKPPAASGATGNPPTHDDR